MAQFRPYPRPRRMLLHRRLLAPQAALCSGDILKRASFASLRFPRVLFVSALAFLLFLGSMHRTGSAVLKWKFPKCSREPQPHEIWSRRFSRVQLRPRRVLRPRKRPAETGRVHLAPVGKTRQLRRRDSARWIFLRR